MSRPWYYLLWLRSLYAVLPICALMDGNQLCSSSMFCTSFTPRDPSYMSSCAKKQCHLAAGNPRRTVCSHRQAQSNSTSTSLVVSMQVFHHLFVNSALFPFFILLQSSQAEGELSDVTLELFQCFCVIFSTFFLNVCVRSVGLSALRLLDGWGTALEVSSAFCAAL